MMTDNLSRVRQSSQLQISGAISEELRAKHPAAIPSLEQEGSNSGQWTHRAVNLTVIPHREVACYRGN